MNPPLDESFAGAGTTGDPIIASYAFEFTESDATNLGLVDIDATKEVTCYMTANNIDNSLISAGTDLTGISQLTATSVVINALPNTPANENTSSADNIMGMKAVLALAALFSFMAIY